MVVSQFDRTARICYTGWQTNGLPRPIARHDSEAQSLGFLCSLCVVAAQGVGGQETQ
jgi:hypothetical protein